MSFAQAAGAVTGPGRRSAVSRSPVRPKSMLARYLARFDEDTTLRWAFAGLLIGAATMFALDLRDMARDNYAWQPQAAVSIPVYTVAPQRAVTEEPVHERPGIAPAALDRAITYTLLGDGVLLAKGTILPGSARRLAAELDVRGEAVRIISFNSPGGALNEAIALGEVIRERGLATEVRDGALCASSCPLAVAGGDSRTVGSKARIGVHQFYEAAKSGTGPAQALADAQVTTARVSRHLIEMGIDPAIWLHALDTPPQSLYYFSPDELVSYRFVTSPMMTAEKPQVRPG